MKRTISALLAALLICTLAACSNQPIEPSDPPVSPPASSNPAVMSDSSTPPEATPEREPYSAMDIFDIEFNPYGMDWPGTVFEASFSKGSNKLDGKCPFTLSMTGEGNMYACIAYQADVAGLGLDEGGKFALLEEYRANDYFCEFEGADGRIVTIRQTDRNDDRYEYVEADGTHGFTGGGCVIDITFYVDEADVEEYVQLVQDNYNLNALSPIADYFDTATDFSECGISVNLHKDEAKTFVVYYVPDAETIRQNIAENVESDWWEWNGMMNTAFMYDDVNSKLVFDTEDGAITVEQTNTQLNAALGSELSLTKLGFSFDDAGICGVYEEHAPFYSSVAVTRPEWGDFANDWNMEFNDSNVNGYSVVMWYYADEDRYEIQIDRDNASSKYTYYTKGLLDFCYPDTDTVRQMFNAAFGTEGDGFYHVPYEHFEKYVQERFMLSVDELYEVPKQ